MGAKQSYSLNQSVNDKQAARGEVAQTFNTAEPNPILFKPVPSVRVNRNNEDQCCTSESDLSPAVSSMIPVDELYIDPELPHSILVLDKENIHIVCENDIERASDKSPIRPDGETSRQPEIIDCGGLIEPTPVVYDLATVERLEYGNELVPQQLELFVDTEPKHEVPSIQETIVKTALFLQSNVSDPFVEHLFGRTLEYNEV